MALEISDLPFTICLAGGIIVHIFVWFRCSVAIEIQRLPKTKKKVAPVLPLESRGKWTFSLISTLLFQAVD